MTGRVAHVSCDRQNQGGGAAPLDAPRGNIWRCWTEPALLMQWFCPKPWFVSEARIDLRPGGEFYTLMNGPNGEEMPLHGVYLEVVEGEKIVFTDAFSAPWQPSEKPFMMAIVSVRSFACCAIG